MIEHNIPERHYPADDGVEFDYDPPAKPFDFLAECEKQIARYREKAGLRPLGEVDD